MSEVPQFNNEVNKALLSLFVDYEENLAPILHLAFAEVRRFYDRLYSIGDVFQEFQTVEDELDTPLDQILTNIRLIERIFDKLVRPIYPQGFAKDKKNKKLQVTSSEVLINFLENASTLLRMYSDVELDAKKSPENLEDLRKIIIELNILCVLFIRIISNPES